eukprot:TRINITY_DN6842_c0_g1_i1.p1 TRINITY_DN6842_c0_g1~~TRINITY_DN6842_c0_g1_i1.p1  ORF type:complete len:208 (-),score=35.17 TRINITY_DN6842_c0_g1_i1:77-700(-)
MAKPSGLQTTMVDGKIVLLGDTGVGKTSLALRFAKDQFKPKSTPTIGASFLVKTLDIDDKRLKMQIWDTAGQERFRSLAPMYYRGAVSAILVFDLTNQESFRKMKEWVNELQTNVDDDIIMNVVGNKIDRVEKNPDRRKVTVEEAKAYAATIKATYYEVSAKTSLGIEDLFTEVGKKIVLTKGPVKPTPPPVINQNKPQASSQCCGN